MIRIEKSIDPYPKFSFMTLAERASYESSDEKAKDKSCLKTYLKSKSLKSQTFSFMVLAKKL